MIDLGQGKLFILLRFIRKVNHVLFCILVVAQLHSNCGIRGFLFLGLNSAALVVQRYTLVRVSDLLDPILR